MTTHVLKDKRIIIIGGSSGIGLATAKLAADCGAHVVIAGRSAEKLDYAKNEINSKHVKTYSLNNQSEHDVELFFREEGHFDHLFTPGASYVLGPVTASTDISESSFKGKFWPQFYAAKHAVPYISPSGSIVLMSGGFSQRPLSGGAAYGACNGAIESLGKALAVELAPVRVNVVSPGTIWREGQEGTARGEAFKEYEKVSLLQRVGFNEEIAHTVIYLMTNSFTTGSTLYPDGGYVYS